MALELGTPVSALCKRYQNIAKQKYPHPKVKLLLLFCYYFRPQLLLFNSQLESANFLRFLIWQFVNVIIDTHKYSLHALM